jgi:hypothetical protein
MEATPSIIFPLNPHFRSARFRYRHSVFGAAQEIGVPPSWVWYWICNHQLRTRIWLRRVWVRLEDVQKLFTDARALEAAFYATGEPLTSPKAIQETKRRWPGLPKEIWGVEAKSRPQIARVTAA